MTAKNSNKLDKRDWSLVKEWLEFSPELIEKIKKTDPDRYDRIKFRVNEYARASAAIERFTELDSTNIEDLSQGKQIATILITVLGSFFYARGAYLLFSNLGQLALFASLIVGLAASFMVDWLLTKAFSNRLSSVNRMQVIQDAKNIIRHSVTDTNQGGRISDLKQYFIDQKISFVETIERLPKVNEFPINVFLAIILNIIEYLSAIFVINQIFSSVLEISLPFQMIIGLLPVALTWAAASIKAQSFGFMEYHQKSRKRYFLELFPASEADDIYSIEQQRRKDKKLDSGIQVLIKKKIDKSVPSANAAEYLFDCKYYHEEKLIKEKSRDKKLADIAKKYKLKEAKLNENWSNEITRRIGNISIEIEQQLDDIRRNPNPEDQKNQIQNLENDLEALDFDQVHQKIIDECEQKRIEGLDKLKKNQEFDETQIKDEYDAIISYFKEEYDKTHKKYQDECAQLAQANANNNNISQMKRKYTGEAGS